MLQTTLLSFLLLGQTPVGVSEPELMRHEVQLLCGLPASFTASPHRPTDVQAFRRVASQTRTIVSRNLPSAVRCGGQRRVLRRGDAFLDQLGFTLDGRFARLSGGRMRGPLNGRGSECFFEQRGRGWSFLGCQATWVS